MAVSKMERKSRKIQIKKIQQEIDRLREMLKELELRPCKHNTEIFQKEREIEDLKKRINSLESECKLYMYPWWQKKK